MPIEDFQTKEELGRGSFGKVLKVVRKSDGEIYAMKMIKLHKLKQKDKKNALNEIRFLASVSHPNIVSYREAFYDEKSQTLCIVMDFANEGDLSTKIKKHLNAKVRIKEEFIWKSAFDLLSGLSKLHESNIIHRDIKPANVFYNNGTAQLGDLNVSKHLKDPFTVTQTGTPYYASPEVWSEEPYNYKSDIWSLGCVLYEMAMLKPPFRAQTPEKLFKKILQGAHEPISSYYSQQFSNFISKMLTQSQNKRPNPKQLLCEEKMLGFLQDLEEEKEEKKLLSTIKFPKNLKFLNQNLPKSSYNVGQVRFKTAKIIKNVGQKKNSDESKKLISIPSTYAIKSQKFLHGEHISKGLTLIRKTKILNKNGSQKLII